MGAETEASGLVESSRPEDADEQAARLSTVDHGAAVAQDMSPPEARLEKFANHLAYGIPGGDQLGRHGNARTSLAITNPSGAVAGPPDAGQEAAPADGERLRLARELHDTIASAIAVIAIQAGVADHALERCETEPGRARGRYGPSGPPACRRWTSCKPPSRPCAGRRVRTARSPAWPSWRR